MSELGRHAVRGALVVTLGQISLAAAGFVTALLLARELGPAAYGVYGIVTAVLVGFEQIGRLGIPQATSRLVAEADGADRRLERSCTTLVLTLFLALFVVMWVGAPWLEAAFAIPDGTRLLRFAALDVPPFALFSMGIAVLNGRRDFLLEGVANIVYAVTRTAGLLLVLPFGLTIEAALLVTVAASLVGGLVAVARLGAQVLRPRFAGFAPILKVAAPVAVAWGAVGLLSNLDLWALNAFGDTVGREVKGWYTAALNLARLPTLAAFVATSILVPTIARALSAGDRAAAATAVRGGTRLLLLVLLPTGAVVAAEARGLLELLFSKAYGDGAALLGLLVFAHGVLYTLFITLGSMLLAAGRERLSALLAPVAAGIALCLAPAATLLAGAIGTATAALLTGLLACAMSARLTWGVLGPLTDVATAARVLLATGLVTGFVILVPSSGAWLVLELGLAAGLYLGLAVATGLLGPADLAVLRPSAAPRAPERAEGGQANDAWGVVPCPSGRSMDDRPSTL